MPSTPRLCSRSAPSGPSFASCFGASAPLSPRRASANSSLAGLACANYRRLQWSDIDDEESCCGDWPGLPCREWPTLKLGAHASPGARLFRRGSHTSYASEGEQEVYGRTNGPLKLGRTRSAAVRSGEYPKKSPVEDDALQCTTSPKGMTEKSEAEEVDEAARLGRRRGMKERLRIRTKSSRKESGSHVDSEGSPRKASFGERVREACAHVMESARRGSPHLCELFVGNHLLMQVPAASSFHARRYAMSSAPPSPYALYSVSNNIY